MVWPRKTTRLAICHACIARDLAAQQGEIDVSFQAIAELARSFEVDALAMKSVAIEVAAKLQKSPQDNEIFVPKVAAVLDQAIAVNRYELAKTLSGVALASARLARNAELLKQVTATDRAREQTAADFAAVQPAIEALGKDMLDPAANLAVGRFHCFIKADWKQGLPMLLNGSDEALKRLAEQELAGGIDPLPLADAWWALAETLEVPAKTIIQQHAADWYRMALPKLVGLVQVKAERRIAAAPVRLVGSSDPAAPESKALPREAPAEVKLAITEALKWLAAQQRIDGSWSFRQDSDSGALDAPIAATAMTLLPLLQAGHTHKDGLYKEQVAKGLAYLTLALKIGPKGGDLREARAMMYGHGMATQVLCDAYSRTKDRELKEPAQLAVNFIVSAQDPKGGGWRYEPQQAGDTSVLGWQLTALKMAEEAKLTVPAQTFIASGKFLDSVQADGGAKYGYRSPGVGQTTSTSAIGLLCRIYLGAKPEHPTISRGITEISQNGVSRNDSYFNYQATRLIRQDKGEVWTKWRNDIQRQLIATQEKTGATSGSWNVMQDVIVHAPASSSGSGWPAKWAARAVAM